MHDLGTLAGYDNSEAFDINNSGQIVGDSGQGFPGEMISNGGAGFLYDGTMHALATSNTIYASGINATGQITGEFSPTGGPPAHVFVETNGATQDLGDPFGGGGSVGLGINDSGQVVGFSLQSDGVTSRAFVSNGGTLQDIGTFGGRQTIALDINNAGQVVGVSGLPDNSNHAFLYSNGTLVDLNSQIDPAAGWVLLGAASINEAGQIAGAAELNGLEHAIILTPNQVVSTTPP